MTKEIDYEALIAEHSRKVSEQIKREAALTGTEEDLRITAAHALRDFLQIAKPEGSNMELARFTDPRSLGYLTLTNGEDECLVSYRSIGGDPDRRGRIWHLR